MAKMKDESTNKKQIPKPISAQIKKVVYGYSGINDLKEPELITLTNLLSQYYPLSQEEYNAVLLLQEWMTFRAAIKESGQKIQELHNLMESGVNKWANMIEGWIREDRYRKEQYYEGRHYKESPYNKGFNPSEKIPPNLYKKLLYDFHSGDPDAIFELVNNLIREALSHDIYFGSSVSIPNIPPPTITIPPEVVDATKEYVEQVQEKLSQYTNRVASSKQFLTNYIYKIVSSENIYPDNK
jgi:hypothetical protein